MANGSIRIIGGKWRSRKIDVPDIEGLRPTPDSVRETVFNWLQHDIVGAHCLDLFSGTGSMAFEALSRGASKVTLVEKSPIACKQIYASAQKLQINPDEFVLVRQEVITWLEQLKQKKVELPSQAFDVVFLDPPYHQDWLPKVLPIIFSRDKIDKIFNSGCLLYIESEKMLAENVLPPEFAVIKYKKTGMVHYYLVRECQK